jgi:cyanophycin synthetase
VLWATIDLEEFTEVSSSDLPGFKNRLLQYLPGLEEHRCSVGERGGFLQRLERGTYFAHIIEHLSLELSKLAGIEVGFGKAIYAGKEGLYSIVVRFKCESGMKYLLEVAMDLARAAARELPFDLNDKIEKAKKIVSKNALGPSTRAILDAADRRGIPWRRMNALNLIQLGYGSEQQRIQATTTSRTGNIAVDIAQDKDFTKELLKQANVRVPKGEVVYTLEEAITVFKELGVPVAIKPVDGNHGKGVSLDLTTDADVAKAFEIAKQYSDAVLIEELFVGQDFRVLLVGGKVVAAAHRIPAHVVGDGRLSVAELIEEENKNPLRGEGHEKPMTKLTIDTVSETYLKRIGMRLDHIPAVGEVVYLRQTANLSTGGSAKDVTDFIHPEVRSACERAARAIGLDVCGIDLVLSGIDQPLKGQRGGIIEVNAGPGIRMHHFPSEGKPRDVGGAIIDHLFPKGKSGRIPILSITGTNGKTTVTRLIGHILQKAGRTVGMTTTSGVFIDGEEVMSGDTTGPQSARMVLSDPKVEVAVLETARGGIVRRGLGYDYSDVGIITNVREDHIGQDGIETVEDILRIKSLVAEQVAPGGTIIFNRDDSILREYFRKYAQEYSNRKLVSFSLHGDRIRTPLDETRYYLSGNIIYECMSGVELPIVDIRQVPITIGGTAKHQVQNIMAAVAAVRSQGISVNETSVAVQTFAANRNNVGRGNFYRLNRGYAFIDYGHNPDAMRAIGEMAAQWTDRKVTAVIAAPGDRSEAMIRKTGAMAAQVFNRIIVREDIDLRGRKSGETAQILCNAVREENVNVSCEIILSEKEAFRKAASSLGDEDVMIFFYDDFSLAKGLLEEVNAVSVDGFEIRMPLKVSE